MTEPQAGGASSKCVATFLEALQRPAEPLQRPLVSTGQGQPRAHRRARQRGDPLVAGGLGDGNAFLGRLQRLGQIATVAVDAAQPPARLDHEARHAQLAADSDGLLILPAGQFIPVGRVQEGHGVPQP